MIIKKNDDRNLLPTDVIGSSVARSKRWLVAIVRICHEKKTGERLTKMGIENFLPIQQEVHQWSDRRKIVDRVLLPMMIFVHVDLQEQKEVLTLSSISRYMVLRGESTPAVIPDQQMLRFKFIGSGRENTGNQGTIGRIGRGISTCEWEIESCCSIDNVRVCMCRYTGWVCRAGI